MKHVITLLCSIIPLSLLAHGSDETGFMAGFTHPIFGLDHSLAIIGISFYGLLVDSKKWVVYPTVFILFLILGGTIGIGTSGSMMTEKLIAASVLLIGMTISFSIHTKTALSLLLIAIFGFIHGCAHGAEIPENTTAFQYISGYSFGAMLLSVIGYGIFQLAYKRQKFSTSRIFIGGLICGSGLVFLLS